jgi:hypothetical protein
MTVVRNPGTAANDRVMTFATSREHFFQVNAGLIEFFTVADLRSDGNPQGAADLGDRGATGAIQGGVAERCPPIHTGVVTGE